jgi:uncharacterized protein with NAD-binding domain and iron-sulfur cluster
MLDVVVLGGGIAGFTCAVALADRGLRVAVVEREKRFGGRASSWTDGRTGDTVDIGPHVFHSEYANMLAFLERLGTRDLITWQPGKVLTIASQPRRTVLRHSPLPPPLSLVPSMLPAPGLSLRDQLSMRRTGLAGMRYGEEQAGALDALNAEDFLRGMDVTETMLDWWWRFAAMVVASVPLERCSAASLLRIHAQLSGYRGLHFGFGAVGLGELYVRQAIDAVDAAGGRVLGGKAAVSLLGEQRVEGVVLADGGQLRARHCVSALPPADLAALLPPGWDARAGLPALDAFEASPYICCYLWFDRRVMDERFVAHLWSPDRLNYDFYDLSRIRRGWERRHSVVCSNIIYSHRAHAMSDDEIVAATVRELAEFAPAASQARVLHARVHRVPMAIPCPVVGFEARRPPAATALPGLVLAGDWTRTHMPCTMESAARSGWLAAEQVLRERGTPAALVKPIRMYDGLARTARRRFRRQLPPGDADETAPN